MMNKEKIEELLFKSVENDLENSEKSQLDSMLATDMQLKSDFDLWQRAHLRDIEIDDYPNISELVKEKRSPLWRKRFLFFMGLLIGAFLWMPFAFKSEKEQQAFEIEKPLEVENIISSIALEENNLPATVAPSKEVSVGKISKKVMETKTMNLTENTDEIRVFEDVYAPQKVINENLSAVNFKERKLNSRKVFYQKDKSKKELRKEKRQQRREECKPEVVYIKGNGPGVIPINKFGF